MANKIHTMQTKTCDRQTLFGLSSSTRYSAIIAVIAIVSNSSVVIAIGAVIAIFINVGTIVGIAIAISSHWNGG